MTAKKRVRARTQRSACARIRDILYRRVSFGFSRIYWKTQNPTQRPQPPFPPPLTRLRQSPNPGQAPSVNICKQFFLFNKQITEDRSMTDTNTNTENWSHGKQATQTVGVRARRVPAETAGHRVCLRKLAIPVRHATHGIPRQLEGDRGRLHRTGSFGMGERGRKESTHIRRYAREQQKINDANKNNTPTPPSEHTTKPPTHLHTVLLQKRDKTRKDMR